MSGVSSNETTVQEKHPSFFIHEETTQKTCLEVNKLASEDTFISLKIFTNQASFYPFDQCILSKKELKLNKEVTIRSSSTLYINIQDSRVKLVNMSDVTEQVQKGILKKGYKHMVDINLNFDHHGSAYFDIKPSTVLTSLSERSVMKSTFVSIGEQSLDRFKIESSNVLKFGREVYLATVTSDILSQKFEWFQDKKQHMVLEGPCRICLSSDDSVQNDRVIAPCFCKGSCGLVHVQCLKTWLRYRMIISNSSKVITYNLNSLRCEICKTVLPKYITVNQSIQTLFPFPEQSQQNFLILERLNPKDEIAYLAPFKETSEIDISLGRFETNDIYLNDSSISRRHANLNIQGGSIYVTDNNSKYGTFVELQKEIRGLKEVILVKDRFVFYLKIERK